MQPHQIPPQSSPYSMQSLYDKDPKWPIYDEKNTFIDWLEMMLITASSSRKHQHLVVYNVNNSNQLEFRTPLNNQDNVLLYKTLLDGLPSDIATSHASTLQRNHRHHDGLALLARLRNEYNKLQNYTESGKQNLIDKLRTLTRRADENFKDFNQRFEKHLTTMHDASADIPADKELAKLLLIGLNSTTI